jgi:hypothetical protein
MSSIRWHSLLGMGLCVAALCARPAPAHSAGPAWHGLLEDRSAPELRGWQAPGLPNGWSVAGGVLSKSGPVDDLVTSRNYQDFELELEWKLGKGGNSGIFYRGTRDYDHIYWSAPEYQLLDDANAPDGASRLTSAAAAYALYGAPAGILKPFGHWNTARILVRGHHVEHWLNGHKVVSYDLDSADWRGKVGASKFSAYPRYGLAETGMIGIQGDHPGELAIRRLRIRELR